MISPTRNIVDVLRDRIVSQATGNRAPRLDAGSRVGRGSTTKFPMTYRDQDGNIKKKWKPTRHGWFDDNAIVS